MTKYVVFFIIFVFLYVWIISLNWCVFLLGKGLTLVASVIEGDFGNNSDKAEVARNAIKEAMKQEKTKGFADVIIAKDVAEGLSYLWAVILCIYLSSYFFWFVAECVVEVYNCAIVCWLLLVLILMFLVAKAKFGFDVALLATKCDFKAITAMFLVGFLHFVPGETGMNITEKLQNLQLYRNCVSIVYTLL